MACLTVNLVCPSRISGAFSASWLLLYVVRFAFPKVRVGSAGVISCYRSKNAARSATRYSAPILAHHATESNAPFPKTFEMTGLGSSHRKSNFFILYFSLRHLYILAEGGALSRME